VQSCNGTYTYHDGLSAASKVPTYVSSKPDAYGRPLYISRCEEGDDIGVWYCSDSLGDIGRPAGGLRSTHGPLCVGPWQYIASGDWVRSSARVLQARDAGGYETDHTPPWEEYAANEYGDNVPLGE
jgi:hypothetical protein